MSSKICYPFSPIFKIKCNSNELNICVHESVILFFAVINGLHALLIFKVYLNYVQI